MSTIEIRIQNATGICLACEDSELQIPVYIYNPLHCRFPLLSSSTDFKTWKSLSPFQNTFFLNKKEIVFLNY